MKIALPSRGLLGTKIIDLRAPTFGDLRNVNSMNQQEGLLIDQFTVGLFESPVDLSTITKFDLDYCYAIAVGSLSFNKITFDHVCKKCGTVTEGEVLFGEQDVISLRKERYPFRQKINGVDYEYHILSAKQDIDAWEYALTQEDEQSAYEDACVAFILGKTVEDMDWVHKLPASIFISALAYQQYNFHGVHLDSIVECSNPDCRDKTRVRIKLSSTSIRVDLSNLMQRYTDVSHSASFETFFSFTMNDYKTFVDALNSKVRK